MLAETRVAATCHCSVYLVEYNINARNEIDPEGTSRCTLRLINSPFRFDCAVIASDLFRSAH